MKLKIRTDIYERAKACADKVDMAVGAWCGLACIRYAPACHLSVVANDELRGVATTVATINGDWFAGHARRCIAAAVDAVEAINARNPSWFGVSTADPLAKAGEMIKAIESANKSAAKSRLQFKEVAA